MCFTRVDCSMRFERYLMQSLLARVSWPTWMFAHGPGSKCRLGYWALFGLLMMPLASIAQTCATPPGLAWGQVQDDFGVKVAGPFVTGFAACAAIAPAITGVSDGAGGYLTFSVSSASPGGPPIANVQNEVLSCWLVGNSGNSSPYYGDAANAYPQAGGCPLYWIQVTLPGQCATCNGVGHPIDPLRATSMRRKRILSCLVAPARSHSSVSTTATIKPASTSDPVGGIPIHGRSTPY